jgi:hypothetical protein
VKLHFNKRFLTDLDALIKKYPEREFESPYRSTVPLLSLMKHGGDTWAAILGELGMSGQADLHVEFTVSSPKGRGKASHTDLMLRDADRVQAVEAKWGEPQYETVAKSAFRWSPGPQPGGGGEKNTYASPGALPAEQAEAARCTS